ncbi:MAG: hypothetical protein RRY79_05645 [Clostridia bacterium]
MPRKIMGYHTSEKLFEKELDKIYAATSATANVGFLRLGFVLSQ